MPAKKRVLILCTGNSARSQMAEGLLRHDAGDRFEVESAGTKPSHVRPEAIAAMNELGIDISGHRSKSVDEFTGQQFDYVLTVCDNAKESCPIFPGQTVTHSSQLRRPSRPAGFGGGAARRVPPCPRRTSEVSDGVFLVPPILTSENPTICPLGGVRGVLKPANYLAEAKLRLWGSVQSRRPANSYSGPAGISLTYFNAMLSDCEATPPAVTTTGTSPVPAPVGTTSSTCITPAICPGAEPA